MCFMAHHENSAPDQSALVLIVDQVQGIVCPGFSDLLEVLFESHFPLSLDDNILDEGLVPLQVEVVHLAQSEAVEGEQCELRASSQSKSGIPVKAGVA